MSSSISAVSNVFGVASLVSTISGVIFLVVVFSAFALFFIVAIGNRTDADPTGSRPMAAFLFSGAFLFLWVSYIGIYLIGTTLINLIGTHNITFAGGFTVPGPGLVNDTIRGLVLGGLLAVFAGFFYMLHLQRGNSLANAEVDVSGPTRRIMRSYVALVSFLTIVVVVLALIGSAWLVCSLISPTIFFGGASRTTILRSLLDSLLLVFLAAGIFGYHQRFAPDSLRLLSMGTSGSHHAHPHDDGTQVTAPTV
jgi:hypothetical protein